MAFVAALMAVGKPRRWRRGATYWTAAILLGLGVLLLAAPDTIPGLPIHGAGLRSRDGADGLLAERWIAAVCTPRVTVEVVDVRERLIVIGQPYPELCVAVRWPSVSTPLGAKQATPPRPRFRVPGLGLQLQTSPRAHQRPAKPSWHGWC